MINLQFDQDKHSLLRPLNLGLFYQEGLREETFNSNLIFQGCLFTTGADGLIQSRRTELPRPRFGNTSVSYKYSHIFVSGSDRSKHRSDVRLYSTDKMAQCKLLPGFKVSWHMYREEGNFPAG